MPKQDWSRAEAAIRGILQSPTLDNAAPREGHSMKTQIKFGRIAGISVGLHYSWFIIAALITLSPSGHFHSASRPAGGDIVFVRWR